MAISKRTRFEVLRRDGFKCTYCGRSGAETELHVDHVVAVALGGSDSPNNLTTACSDCNLGKASTTADAPMIHAVELSAASYDAARRNAAQASEERMEELGNYEDSVLELWERYAPSYAVNRTPSDFASLVASWFDLGAGLSLVENAIRIAAGAKSIPWGKKLTYAGGVIRRRMNEVMEQQAHTPPVDEGPSEDWSAGYGVGRTKGWERAAIAAQARDVVQHHIDHTEMERDTFGMLTGRVVHLAS